MAVDYMAIAVHCLQGPFFFDYNGQYMYTSSITDMCHFFHCTYLGNLLTVQSHFSNLLPEDCQSVIEVLKSVFQKI